MKRDLRRAYRFGFLSTASALALSAAASHAAINTSVQAGRAFPKPQFEATQKPISDDEPLLLEADQVDYDQENEVVTAAGHVEVVQGETVLVADQLIYDQKNNKVYARGNASILEASGNVMFFDEVELTDDMKQGVTKHFGARLADDSLFAAARARKLDENTYELDKAVYSPCRVDCDKGGEERSPMWQIKTDHVVIDQLEHRATYDDTYFEIFGVPILYTPYLSHSLPGGENKSGFMMPTYQLSNNVGTMLHVPYYYAIAPDRDVTLTPIFTSAESTVMAGQYRQRFDSGGMTLDGSITRPQDRDPQGNLTSGRQIRGNINALGTFDVEKHSGWGFDVHRVTDDTYLRRYDFAQDTLLTSRAYGFTSHFMEEGSRSLARVQSVAFQGLTAQDNRRTIPLALPLADFNYQSAPGAYGSRFTTDANALLLHRELGADSRRLSSRFGWELPYISDDGQVIEFATHLRADIYEVSDVALSDGRQFDGATGRLIPDVTATWRYPFINRLSSDSSVMLEPVVQMVVSPGGGNTEKIPNEDSLVPEFTESNLFSDNRYPGFDRVETGPRASYGLRGQAQIFSTKFVDWLVGQHYRLNNDRTFPYSNDLQSHFSDYVGKVGVTYDVLSLAYRFRLDKDTFAPKRSEIDSSIRYGRVGFDAAYLSLKDDPVLATKQVLNASSSLYLTGEWTLSGGLQRDLELDFTNYTFTELVFANECTNIAMQVGRTYTRDRDIEPSTNILFRISFKNLE